MFGYNIWHTLFLPTEVFLPWPREPNCPSKFSIMDDFCAKQEKDNVYSTPGLQQAINYCSTK